MFLFPKKGKVLVTSREDRSVKWVAAKSQFFAVVLTAQDLPAVGAEARKVELSGQKMRDGSSCLGLILWQGVKMFGNLVCTQGRRRIGDSGGWPREKTK
jgi:hypothetical protein